MLPLTKQVFRFIHKKRFMMYKCNATTRFLKNCFQHFMYDNHVLLTVNILSYSE